MTKDDDDDDDDADAVSRSRSLEPGLRQAQMPVSLQQYVKVYLGPTLRVTLRCHSVLFREWRRWRRLLCELAQDVLCYLRAG